jgi:lantibiotic modifying enzyme
MSCADLHRQNWIASGEHPVLIDAEMLGDAFSKPDSKDSFDVHLHPLLKTGMLPLFQTDRVGYYSGFAPFEGSGRTTDRNILWLVYSGRIQYPHRYADEILKGFTAAARFVCTSRQSTPLRGFVLKAAHRKSLRVLKRATMQYQQILYESLQPRHMQNRGQRFEYLLRRCGPDRLAEIEARALFRCCVPRFTKNLNLNLDRRHERRSVPSLCTMLKFSKNPRLSTLI